MLSGNCPNVIGHTNFSIQMLSVLAVIRPSISSSHREWKPEQYDENFTIWCS